MSMAAGEYVSVSSQSDTERADLTRERKELKADAASELEELTAIYVNRGLDRDLAGRVANQLMAKDALAAHARDELGISEFTTAHPVQAALTSAATFAFGAAMPLLMAVVAPAGKTVLFVSLASLGFLALLGAVGAKADRNRTRDVLGRAGDGRDRRPRCIVGGCRLKTCVMDFRLDDTCDSGLGNHITSATHRSAACVKSPFAPRHNSGSSPQQPDSKAIVSGTCPSMM